MSQKQTRERRYTSQACLACRRRKVKCNNERPRCSNCVLYDNAECIYGLDRRRASSSVAPQREPLASGYLASTDASAIGTDAAANVASLNQSASHEQLLPTLADHLPSHTSDDVGGSFLHTQIPDQEWHYWPSPSDTGQLPPGISLDLHHDYNAFEDVNPSAFHHDQYFDAFNVDDDTPQTSPASQDISPTAIATAGPQTIGPTAVAKPEARTSRLRSPESDGSYDAFSDVTRQLTSRLGKLQIAEDGRPRYYGATSNLHLLYTGAASLTQPNIRDVRLSGNASIESAGLQWKGDMAYQTHLTKLFFAWHNNLQFPVDKAIFLREQARFRQGESTDLFTPSLENAILCVGAAYTDRYHPGISGSVDEFFALRTKAYLDIEIDSPSIATAQALLILSSHEAAQTRESRGWIYMGMANQITIDLGLHLDLESEYTRLDSECHFNDVQITRRNVFWTVKSIDTLWSAYSGRPSMMKNIVHNQKSPLPSRTYEWEYYIDEAHRLSFPDDFDLRAAAYVHVHLASLMLILARVSEVLYSGVPDITSDISAFVTSADADFRKWLAALPLNLQLDLTRPFQVQSVLELHLIYHESIILLHRPLMTPVEPTSPFGLVSDQESAAASLSRCLDSADRICSIMVYYRHRYGLKRLHHQMVHAAMTAALIHAFQLCTTSNATVENSKAQASFLTCIQALGEMGQTFKSASRALDVVTSLRQSWRDDASAGDRFKRARLR